MKIAPQRQGRAPVEAGTWVELEKVILGPGERAPGIPADTASVPFAARVRGFLVADTRVGTVAAVKTQAGRTVSGKLRVFLPRNPVDFGDPAPDLLMVGKTARARLEVPKAE